MIPILRFTAFGSELRIPSYNLLVGIGIIAGILVFECNCKKWRIKRQTADTLTIILCISLITGFLSAALFNKIVHSSSLREAFYHLFEFSGITFSGGLFGGLLFFLIFYGIIFKNIKSVESHLDCITPSVVLGHFFGRIGCFLGGCCFGKPSDSIISVAFPAGSPAEQTYWSGVKVLPTQLIEAFFLLLLFSVLYFKLRKQSFAFYFIFYGAFRFFIEFFRGDSRGILLQSMFSPSQCLAMIMIAIGGGLLIRNSLLLTAKKRVQQG